MARRDILDGAKTREIRKKQKRIFYAKVYLGSFLAVALLVGFIFLSRSPKIQIEKVNISGNSAITTEEIMSIVDENLAGKYLFVIPKHNIFLYPQNRIERLILANYLRISDVDIKIDNLKEITVDITEREGKYLWCSPVTDEGGEKCYFADETGYMFDTAPFFSGNTYFKFTGGFAEAEEKMGQLILPGGEFDRVIGFYKGADATLSPIKLTALEIGTNGDYKFSMEGTDGKIIFKKENDFEKLLENLNSAIGEEPLKTDLYQKLKKLLYIDLRFDNKVYFKFQE